MSGKAIIIVVSGVIIISATIMYNIEASSTRIVANYVDYYMRQSAQNVAHAGINLSMQKLRGDRTWRAGFSNLQTMGGSVSVRLSDVTYANFNCVEVFSVGKMDYNSSQSRRDTAIAYVYFPPRMVPFGVRGLISLNGPNQVNGNIIIDGRDHDIDGNLVAGQGTFGIWTTSPTFIQMAGANEIGGTVAGIDFAPGNPANPIVIARNQPGPVPLTPDSVFGGTSSGFPEGTLKAVAQSGVGGSQYVTDPAQLKTDGNGAVLCNGVTYVELPSSSPQNTWAAGKILGSGILIVHNSARNAVFKNADGNFRGVIIADDAVNLHGIVNGAIITFTTASSGNVLGNGNARINFSRQAIQSAVGFLANGSQMNIVAWWE